MTCPSDAELLAYVEGSLAPEARSSAESHLDTCPSCLAIVAALARPGESEHEDQADATGSPKPGPLLPDGEPRYVLGAEIARGGMGRIFAADDRLFGRRVALKTIRRKREGLARRFAREQRITARLQHPAIIPIYDAGTLTAGEPFFAMRLVKGESLDRAAAKATTLADRLRLLPTILGVVDAVAYAHGEGVVHRDLKPQNVLVGPFGEVVVLDWGLAREVDADVDASTEDAGSASEVDPDATRAGEVLGTLAYMAPEQAEGHVADARSDVYGLGAILYHVLTGTPPHTARSVSADGVVKLDVRKSIREHMPDAPSDLAAIVERAMASDPSARYASAQELAEDLKRWQAGRLVEAHRYTPAELFGRFLRRYRAPILVAAAALVVLGAFGGVAVRRIVLERAHAVAEQKNAETARGHAEAQRIAAERLVGFVLGDLRSRLERVGRLDALAGVAKAVMAYQDDSPATDDAATALRRSEISGLAGDVAFATGDLGAAEESYQHSLDAAAVADQKEPAPEARCRAALRLGDVHKRRGELDLASKLYEGCTDLARGLEGPVFKELSVKSWLALAEMARIRGDLPRARKILEDARPVAIALVEEAGGPGSDAAQLLHTLRSDLGQTLFLAGEVRAARDEATAAVDFARARRAARPDDSNARYDLAGALTLLGLAQQTGGDLVSPEALYREALSEHRALAARDPSNAQWQRAVGVDADRMGTLMNARGDGKAALPWLVESKDVSVRVSEIAPSNLEWKRDVFISELTLGGQLSELGRLDDARKELESALAIQERLMDIAPDAGRAARELGLVLNALGDLELKAKRLEAGRARLEQSIQVYERYLGAVDTPALRQDLATGLLLLAANERGAAARGHVEDALKVLEPIRSLAGANPGLAQVLKNADDALAKTGSGK